MLEFLRILLRWRRPLLVFSLLAALVATAVTFVLQPRYYAQASILPPSDTPGVGGLSALLEQYQVPIPGGTATPFLPTLYAAIVRSRKMGTRLLDDFALREALPGRNDEEDVQVLRKRTFLKYTDEGILLVGFEDADAKRGAEITNAYVRLLDEFIREFNSARAGNTRTFVAQQVERCSADLARSEETLRDFQLQHRAIEIDTQTEGALEIASGLQARIIAKEAELKMLQQHALPEAPEVRLKQTELRVLREGYADLLGADPGSLTGVDAEAEKLFPRFKEVPDLALQYYRLVRDVKMQTALYTMLLQQLEQARIEEQKNTHVLSVLDWATPSVEKVFPRRLRIVTIAALAGFVWVAILAVFVEKLRERRASAAEAARLAALRAEWQRMPGWIRSLERLVVK